MIILTNKEESKALMQENENRLKDTPTLIYPAQTDRKEKVMLDEKDYLNEKWEMEICFTVPVMRNTKDYYEFFKHIANLHNVIVKAGIPLDNLDLIPKMVKFLKDYEAHNVEVGWGYNVKLRERLQQLLAELGGK